MSDNGKVFPYPLPVVVATGEYGTGKTLPGLTTGYPLERVCVYDNEQSATVYESMGPFARVDLVEQMALDHPEGWTNLQFYQTRLKHMRAIGVTPCYQLA